MIKRKIYLKDLTYDLSTELSYLFYKVRAFFIKNKYIIVDNVEEADDILVCTYWYLAEVEWFTYDYILSLKDKLKNKKLYIFWDFWSWKNKLSKINYIDDFIPSYNLQKLSQIFDHDFCMDQIYSYDLEQDIIFDWDKESEYENSLYFLEIWSWCIHNCKFCHVKKNIWYTKSKDFNQLVKEFKYAVDNWYKYIILLSEDAWSYWLDIWKNFWELLDAFCSFKWNFKINIHYLYPSLAIKYKDSIFRNISKIHKFLMPIQSFSDKTLKRMWRNYSAKDIINFIKDIRKINKEIMIDNHIIYWFPWETFEEFLNNIKMSDKYYSRTVFIEYTYIEWTKKYDENEIICKTNKKKRKYILFKLIKNYRDKNWDKGMNKVNVLSWRETYEMVLAI